MSSKDPPVFNPRRWGYHTFYQAWLLLAAEDVSTAFHACTVAA